MPNHDDYFTHAAAFTDRFGEDFLHFAREKDIDMPTLVGTMSSVSTAMVLQDCKTEKLPEPILHNCLAGMMMIPIMHTLIRAVTRMTDLSEDEANRLVNAEFVKMAHEVQDAFEDMARSKQKKAESEVDNLMTRIMDNKGESND